MNKQERIKELKKEIEELENQLNDWGKIFYEDYDITSIEYLSDAFHEYADYNTSIYYSDIEEYYKNHIQESCDALKEYGYTLNDFEDLEDAIHKGSQLAEYSEIYNELAENESIFEELIEKLEELEELEKEEE
jgi:DNA repair exonuclease SbcCD ATPase subunit